MNLSVRCLVGLLLIASLMIACSAQVITPDDVLGEWEKQGESLPPIHLELTRDGTGLLARLRLSGVELNGVARLDANQLYLDFPNREPVTGEFTSQSSLNLRLEKLGAPFVLTKKR